jgi:RNA polymerase sigma factor for flagellar operon FliA
VRIPQVEWADYAHNATVGLLEALSRFDPSRGVDFMAFAKPRVRGAVFNGLRSYLQDYLHQGKHPRTDDRLSSWIGGTDDPLYQMIDTVVGLGIGMLLDSAQWSSDESSKEPSRLAERHQLDRLVEAALGSLPARERLVIVMHYQQYVPFVEIARLLKVTKGRVSQIHRLALDRIRKQLGDSRSSGVDA